jgi:hypothetical protein
MPIEKLIEYWKRQPFAPFDIKMSDGRVYTVDHPDFLMRSRDNRTIMFVTEDNREVALALVHITSLEVANSPAAPG